MRESDKIINIIVDSGSGCNLMTEHMFHSLTGEKAPYTHQQQLELQGSCMSRDTVPQTNIEAIAEFYIAPGHSATLLGREMSAMLEIVKVAINVNNCTTNIDNSQPLDNKAALRLKFFKVFEGLGKLKGYQLKLLQDDSSRPLTQPLHRIRFSRRRKVTAKLKLLEELDVIEKANRPTWRINPLVAVAS